MASSIAWALTMPLVPILFYLNFLTGDFLLQQTTPDILSAIRDLTILNFSRLLEIGKSFIIGGIFNTILGLIVIWFLGFLFLKKYRTSALNFVKKYL